MSLARAIETGDLVELPTRRDEDWRWSDYRALVRTLPAAAPKSETAPSAGEFAQIAREAIEVINGRGPVRCAVDPGDRRILALRFIAADPGAQTCRFAIQVGAGANMTLLESHEGEAVSETDIELILAPGARLERIVLADQGGEAVSVIHADVVLAKGAEYAQTIVTIGAKRQRLETRVRHGGGGAVARLDSLYVVGERRHSDLTSVVVHEGPDGDTDQVTKGVATDQGRGVFQGRIEVRPGADRVAARMRHQALVLSDKAEVDAKPELEIFADEVTCSHGNSIGALDEEALFYARQRGIPEPAARAMLTEAFLGEVIERISHEDARETLRHFVAVRMAELT